MTSTDARRAMVNCQVHVALMGSNFDEEVCGKQKRTDAHVEVRVMQPTMSLTRIILRDIVDGHDVDFNTNLINAVSETLQTCQVIRSQREQLQCERDLKRQQDTDYLASEMADKRKEDQAGQRGQEPGQAEEEDKNKDATSDEEQNDTLVDSEEVRKRRIEWLEKEAEANKRPRTDVSVNNDDSGEVILKKS